MIVHPIVLYYMIVHPIVLYDITLYSMILHYVMSYSITLYYIVVCDNMLYYMNIILCCTMLSYAVPHFCHIVLYSTEKDFGFQADTL